MMKRWAGAGGKTSQRRGRLFSLTVLALGVLAVGGAPARAQAPGPEQLAPLTEPFALRSVNGVLDATFVLQEGPAQIAGQTVNGVWTYHVDGMPYYPGPTLYVNPGDTLRVQYVNKLPAVDPRGIDPRWGHTNLHTHGLHVSPQGNSDNVLLDIPPGAKNQYVIRIPADHPDGLYWYHPHRHGVVGPAIFQGLTAMLVIGRPDGGAPELTGAKQRLLAFQYSSIVDGKLVQPIAPSGSPPGNWTVPITFTVNGQLNPRIDIQPGETQIWNLANISNNAYFSLRIRGTGGAADPPIVLVAQDGNPFSTPVILSPQQLQEHPLLMPAGSRYSLLVQGPPVGTYELVMEHWYDGFHNWPPIPVDLPSGAPPPSRTLATIVSAGEPQASTPMPAQLTPPRNYFEPLDQFAVDLRREVIWSTVIVNENGVGTFHALLDGRQFSNTPVLQPRLNTIEEWTLLNTGGTTNEEHPFHIHVNDFQVISLIDPTGQMANITTPQTWFTDTVNIPRKSPLGSPEVLQPGRMVVRMKPLDFLGSYVYHCHRVDHEDEGMMALVTILPEVPIYAAGTSAGMPAKVQVFSGLDNSTLAEFNAFEASFRGAVRVAVGDVNQDAVMDVAVATGPNSAPRVRVLSGKDNFRTELFNFNAARLGLDARFRGGLHVAVGDINSDGNDDLIVAPGSGAAPEVKVFSGVDGTLLGRFMAYDPKFRGGVNVASAIVQEGGRYSIITGPGPGSAQPVKVFDVDWYSANSQVDRGVYTFNETASVMPYGATFRGGVNVGTGPIQGQNGGFAAILTGPASEGPPLVKSFVLRSEAEGHSHTATAGTVTLKEVASLMAYDISYRAGISVSAVSTPVGADVIVGPAGGVPALLKRVRYLPEQGAFAPVTDVGAFGSQFRGGVSVGAR